MYGHRKELIVGIYQGHSNKKHCVFLTIALHLFLYYARWVLTIITQYFTLLYVFRTKSVIGLESID